MHIFNRHIFKLTIYEPKVAGDIYILHVLTQEFRSRTLRKQGLNIIIIIIILPFNVLCKSSRVMVVFLVVLVYLKVETAS